MRTSHGVLKAPSHSLTRFRKLRNFQESQSHSRGYMDSKYFLERRLELPSVVQGAPGVHLEVVTHAGVGFSEVSCE